MKENVKYAVRLRNYGSRTANGDGGMTTVQCPDGAHAAWAVMAQTKPEDRFPRYYTIGRCAYS